MENRIWQLGKPATSDKEVLRTNLYPHFQRKCILINAPAGYGKSNLVSQWLDKTGPNFSWINLEKADQAPELFLRKLNASLPDIPNEIKTFFEKSEKPESSILFQETLGFLAKLDQKITLVLDDYHLIQSEAFDQFFQTLVEKIEGIQLILISRKPFNFPLEQWKAQNLYSLITAEQLIFGTEELRQHLDSIGIDISDETQRVLKERTEGWISGIQIMLFDYKDENDLLHRLVERPGSDQNYFSDLIDSHIQKLDDSDREKLLSLSFFEILSPSLVIDLGFSLGFQDQRLQYLFDANLFLIQIDPKNQLYRFHHLFRENLLRKASSLFSEEKVKKIYETAGSSFLKDSLLKHAAYSFLKSDNESKKIRTFDRFRQKLIEERNWSELKLLLETTDELGFNHYTKGFAECWYSIYMGQTLYLFEKSAELSKGTPQDAPLAHKAELKSLLSYRSYNLSQDFFSCIEECRFALFGLPESMSYARGYAWVFLIGSLQATGKFEEAVKDVNEALASRISVHEQSYILLVLCYCYWMETDLIQLRRVSKNLISLGEKSLNLEAKAHGHYFAAVCAFEKGNWDELDIHLKELDSKGRFAIGLIRFFSQILNLQKTSLKDQEFDLDQLERIYESLIEEENKILPFYLKSLQLNISISHNSTINRYAIKKQVEGLPQFPITNIIDPGLSILAYSFSEQTSDSEKRYKELKSFALTRFNKMAWLRAVITKASLDTNAPNSERIELFSQAIEASQKSRIYAPFLEFRQTKVFLLDHFEEFSGTDKYFIRDLRDLHNRLDEIGLEFSRREKEVLEELTNYSSNQELAKALFITEKTVKNHLTNIYRKLGVKSKKEAVIRLKDSDLLG